ncbi:MAG TPA: sigma 54-interacting transcriptional regulator, partial [Candidatus Tectomicrobia bacterium]
LRVLEQRQIRPVGSDREVRIDVRVLAATNRDLHAAVQHGTFREDLYYRLNVMQVRVPPLHEHAEDIPFLAETFLHRHATANTLGPRRFTHAALHRLEQHPWPGNVRELSHVIERAVTLSEGEWVDVADLGLDDLPPPGRRDPASSRVLSPQTGSLPPEQRLNLDAVTRHLVVTALAQTHGHKSQAAALLGVHPRTLTRMLRRFGLPEE